MRERGNERVAKVQSSRPGAWLGHHGYSIVASLGAPLSLSTKAEMAQSTKLLA